MKRAIALALTALVLPAVASRATAQQDASVLRAPIQHIRPMDQRGIDVFESPKTDSTPYNGLALSLGAAFTQQFQGLRHSNRADPDMVDGVNTNQLISIGNGFNNATANLYMNAQLAKGIRVALTTYLSARHHQETWVKDGYLLVDESPIDNAFLNGLMKHVTLKVGHFEVNYGDQHFRRSDNGNAMFNPFVGNLIMDAFTTEIGGEVYVRGGPFLAMGGITGGELRGQVTAPEKRAPSYLAKVGFDQQIDPALRVRLTGSMYSTKRSSNNTLYSGDRAGSRYYDVLENTSSTETAQAWSGEIQPGFRSKVNALVLNPFVKFHGLELFGNIERAKGRAANETADRTWHQYAGDMVYRFGPEEKLYVGGRYNTASGQLTGIPNDVKVNRVQVGGGWFVTRNILSKVEYVDQKYHDFPSSDIRHDGRFHGFMVEGVVAF
ncbi:MAG TPA: hypothetical protein VFS44_13260 [Gemmatimonadaceae bacterium]|nr:hypothetical protein [Gemmatimonadaceae bacterium]